EESSWGAVLPGSTRSCSKTRGLTNNRSQMVPGDGNEITSRFEQSRFCSPDVCAAGCCSTKRRLDFPVFQMSLAEREHEVRYRNHQRSSTGPCHSQRRSDVVRKLGARQQNLS